MLAEGRSKGSCRLRCMNFHSALGFQILQCTTSVRLLQGRHTILWLKHLSKDHHILACMPKSVAYWMQESVQTAVAATGTTVVFVLASVASTPTPPEAIKPVVPPPPAAPKCTYAGLNYNGRYGPDLVQHLHVDCFVRLYAIWRMVYLSRLQVIHSESCT